MSHGTVSIDDVRRAWDSRDPDLPSMMVALVKAYDPEPAPAREDAYSFDVYRRELVAESFAKLGRDARREFRQTQMARLEAADAEVPLPPRFGTSAVIMELWQTNDAYSRGALLKIIAEIPLKWGPWRALKQIFKDAEAKNDDEIWGALAARFDTAYSQGSGGGEVSRRTLGYLVRRAWRRLRRIAAELPASYPDAACAVLKQYSPYTNWPKTWIASHIFLHNTGKYNRRRFKIWWWPGDLLKDRAYPDLWRRSPRPLFGLLEQAQASKIIGFATEALTTDFRTQLRDVEPAWVVKLIGVTNSEVHDFVIWVLSNVPRFEQSAFGELGLHDPVLTLFDSPSDDAREWTAKYARTHARDLPLDTLLVLTNNDHKGVRRFARDILRERDPRKDVGLEGWGKLLGTEYGHELAVEQLAKHFGARELTPDWFAGLLRSDDYDIIEFASEHLGRVHKIEALGIDWFIGLLEGEVGSETLEFVCEYLPRFDLDSVDVEFLRELLVVRAPSTLIEWVDEEKVPAERLGVDFLKTAAFHVDQRESPWFKALAERLPSARNLDIDSWVRSKMLGWLSDVRRFSPEDIGFEWLMRLVQRTEPEYFEFATEYMIKAFLPADFAGGDGPAEEEPAPASDGEINIDLDGATFVFTGKLATMTRSEAQKKVTAANGKPAKAVNGKLDYLVIGDEGSPLYGQGRKGSKQLKAEKLMEGGAALRVISETAFLQMLAGEQREFSEEDLDAGCQRLWDLATGDVESPLGRFALRYLRRHHPDISLAETDRPVDPGAEIPNDFLTFDRVAGLMQDERPVLRNLGIEFSRYELARWSPSMDALVPLAESRYPEVRQLVADALTADESPEHRRYRLSASLLTADAVYRLCESTVAAARQLGMALIDANEGLALPTELFRLTESPDRSVRAFVVRTLWGLYRDRGVTTHWTKWQAPDPKQKEPPPPEGVPPLPDNPPAAHEAMRDFLRRALFTIPPARLPKRPDGGATLKPLPARRAKLALVEVVRDLALRDADFAAVVTPILTEFLGSRGQTERDACLVALTRISAQHPDLESSIEEVSR